MGLGTRFLKADAATASTPAPLVVTWSANEPTAGLTQTIADGTVPTVAELGQYAANNQAVVAALIADLAAITADLVSIRAVTNAGE